MKGRIFALVIQAIYFSKVLACGPGSENDLLQLEQYLGLRVHEFATGATDFDEENYISHPSQLACNFQNIGTCRWRNSPSDGVYDSLDYYLFEKVHDRVWPRDDVRPGGNPSVGEQVLLTGERDLATAGSVWESMAIKCQTGEGTLAFDYWLYNDAQVEVIIFEPFTSPKNVFTRPTHTCTKLNPSHSKCVVTIPAQGAPFQLGIRSYGFENPFGSFVIIDNIIYSAPVCGDDDTGIDPCGSRLLGNKVSDLCQPHGVCENRGRRAYCVCEDGWGGIDCKNRTYGYPTYETRATRILLLGSDEAAEYRTTEVYFPESTTDNYDSVPMNIPRIGHVAGVLYNNVIVAGGFDPFAGHVVDSSELYAPGKLVWDTGPQMTEPRRYASGVVVGNSLFVCGGDRGTDPNTGIGTNTCERLEYGAFRWVPIAPMRQARTRAAAAQLNGQMFVFGGFGANQELNTVERYDPPTNAWVSLTPMRQARSAPAAAAALGHVYICGGVHAQWTYLNTCEKYNPLENRFMDIPVMDRGRAYHTMVTYNDKLYVFGGCCGDTRRPAQVYDPVTNIWLPIPVLLRPRSSFVGVAV